MQVTVASASFTRPGDATPYTSGDLVANSTAAGSVVPMTFAIPNNRATKLYRVFVDKTTTGISGAAFRLHLYRDPPTVANGDNAAWSSSSSNYQGFIDIAAAPTAFTAGGSSSGVYVNNSVFAPMYIFADTDQLVYGLLEARGAYTPGISEVFTVTLVGETNES
jgi:hypothetical protein